MRLLYTSFQLLTVAKGLRQRAEGLYMVFIIGRRA
jgi:hypothetical protein